MRTIMTLTVLLLLAGCETVQHVVEVPGNRLLSVTGEKTKWSMTGIARNADMHIDAKHRAEFFCGKGNWQLLSLIRKHGDKAVLADRYYWYAIVECEGFETMPFPKAKAN